MCPSDVPAPLPPPAPQVDLGEVYQGVERGAHRYRLRSMVCYYGHQHQRLVVLPVIAHHAAEAVAVRAALHALVHLAQVDLWGGGRGDERRARGASATSMQGVCGQRVLLLLPFICRRATAPSVGSPS